jgi:hypothetical protein
MHGMNLPHVIAGDRDAQREALLPFGRAHDFYLADRSI